MKTTFFIVLSLLILAALAIPASAETVTLSFSDMDISSNDVFYLYHWNGTEMRLLQEVNLTDSVTLDTNVTGTAYLMVYKPTELSWFNDPVGFLEVTIATVPKFLLIVAFALCLIGSVLVVVYAFWRRR